MGRLAGRLGVSCGSGLHNSHAARDSPFGGRADCQDSTARRKARASFIFGAEASQTTDNSLFTIRRGNGSCRAGGFNFSANDEEAAHSSS